MQTLVRFAAYPLVVVGGAALLIVAQMRGVPAWPVAPVMLVIAAIVVALLERYLPYSAAWNQDHDDSGTDVLHFIGNLGVSHASIGVFAVAREVWPGAALWPTSLPFWAQALIGLAVADLGLYGVHRASHGVGWLWRLHAIHHSPRRVYWVNGQRRHLAHELLEGMPGLVALFVLGAPAAIYTTAIAIVTLHLFMQHANIDYVLGPFRRVFAGAEVHRWHHQRRWRDVQGNYAAVFAMWDFLFGTSLGDRGRAPADVGMDDEPDLPADYVAQLMWPFKRKTHA